jgi:hypothetical protein
MITPSYGLTATERVLPSFTLDWTTGLVQSAVDVTRAGVATFFGSNGLIQSALADTQRIDYLTGTAGLLVEESRTNICLYSEDFSQWDGAFVDVTTAGASIVDGVSWNKLITANGSNLQLGTSKNLTNLTAAAGTWSWSVFAKADEFDRVGLRLRDEAAAGNNISATFDLTDGSIAVAAANAGTFTGATASVVDYGGGVYRCILTGVTTGATALRPQVAPLDSTASTGDGTSGILVIGAQLEAGAFPTSYIPTEASAVTRNADVATVSDLSWFNATEGALFARCSALTTNLGGNKYIFSLCDDSATNAIALRYGGGGTTTTFAVIDSGSATVNTQVGTFAANEITPFLGSYKLNNSATARNGGSVSTDLSCTIPTGIDTVVIGSVSSAGASIMSGHIYKLAYWSQRITNAEVQAFSKG